MFQNCNKCLVFETICQYPTQGLTVRDVAEETGISISTASRMITALEDDDLLQIEKEKNMKKTRGNFESFHFPYYKRVFNIMQLTDLVQTLVEKRAPDAVILFGSYAKGVDTEDSDIDIFLEHPKKNGELAFHEFEEELHRSIQVFEGRLQSTPSSLRNNVLNGVTLYGSFTV